MTYLIISFIILLFAFNRVKQTTQGYKTNKEIVNDIIDETKKEIREIWK
jgi:cell division protein FtsL